MNRYDVHTPVLKRLYNHVAIFFWIGVYFVFVFSTTYSWFFYLFGFLVLTFLIFMDLHQNGTFTVVIIKDRDVVFQGLLRKEEYVVDQSTSFVPINKSGANFGFKLKNIVIAQGISKRDELTQLMNEAIAKNLRDTQSENLGTGKT